MLKERLNIPPDEDEKEIIMLYSRYLTKLASWKYKQLESLRKHHEESKQQSIVSSKTAIRQPRNFKTLTHWENKLLKLERNPIWVDFSNKK